ncbi:OmpA family protein [uncultured Muribaculum sp.]|uniref:OmpA family protein n=1 Tax=uncultured Muribaculum sp. TaxID=1918613 RepID=UPI0025D40288|nr:OmpA family protein [uncultured Muribaculum sp.]
MSRILLVILSLCILSGTDSTSARAENIFQKIARIGANPDKHKGDSIAPPKSITLEKKSKKKDYTESTDPLELSLDENLAVPHIGDKQKQAVTGYMNEVAKKLAQRKIARIETMRSGEVVVATIGTDLLFAPNDTVLRSTAPEILSPYRSLLSRGIYKFVITCHTDDTGSTSYTDRLSEARVNAIDIWLSRNLPSETVVVPYALGATEPMYLNDSQSHRASNRRIEIFIVPDERLIDLAKSGKLSDNGISK